MPRLADDRRAAATWPRRWCAASAAPVSAASGGRLLRLRRAGAMLGGGIDGVSATANLGFNWIKQQVEWRNFEGSQGAIDFSELRAGGRRR
ncbi:MAG: hypothetical protein R2854_06005 [Caldilineaceae bacterium]